MAERICLLTGNETTCNDGCYNCGCGGEVALNDFYVPIYNIQQVCDIVKDFECTSIEGEEIAEYIRNELEKMTVCIEKKASDVQPVKRGKWIWKERHRNSYRVVKGIDKYGKEGNLQLHEVYKVKVNYCSVCGKQGHEAFLNFCPNCGADMRGENDD